MKKLLSLLTAALLLPLVLGAQTLGPNQMLLGHYTTDSVRIGSGWGMNVLAGVRPIATDLTAEELAFFQGSKIVAFRVGLAESTPVTRVFVIPIDGNGNLGTETEWECNVSNEGWNIVTLDAPYLISLPSDYSLRIGFDYEQIKSGKPISAVKVGTIYPSYINRNGSWINYGLSTSSGNLSVQLICENDNFPQYVIRMKDLNNKSTIKIGDNLNFSFKVCSLGTEQIMPGALTFDVAIDGTVVKTISNPAIIAGEYVSISDFISTADLTAGEHTLTVTTVTLNGEPVENPVFLSSTFSCFEFGFTRQMRLVEQFTSTGCTWCPTGSRALQALCDLRGDIAWVGVHVLYSSPTDPFASSQNDSIASFEHCTGYPEGSFDRYPGIEEPGEVCGVLSYTSPAGGAQVFNSFLESVSDSSPSWATVNINSTFDEATREAKITISGDLVPNFEDFMGSDAKLTVYITENNLVAAQIDQGTVISDYVHNNVLRKVLGSVKGVALKKNGDTYTNEFTYTIPTSWKANDLNIVAFISRPLRSNALTDLYVTNANKRKLGEFDEPTAEPGDANGDGMVNITDVTALIDYLLSGVPVDEDAADCNHDGAINITDVTALIDYLLTGNW
jgi:hypothetical protein